MKFGILVLAGAFGYLVDRAFFYGKYFAASGRILSQMAASFGLR